MIALLVAAAAIVVEHREPAADEVSIQAILPFEVADTVDTAVLETLVRVMPKSVEGYSRRDILTITSGVPITCELEPDHIRVSISVPPANLSSGFGLLDALLHRSRLSDASIREAMAEKEPENYWSAALRPFRTDYDALRPQDVLEAYRRIGSSEDIRVSVGGNFEAGKPTEIWEKRDALVPLNRISRRVSYQPTSKFRVGTPQGVSIVEFAGPEFAAKDAGLPTRLLAIVALGGGKGSSLFRVIRGEQAISYRQEGMIVPTPNGWEPRLAIATKTNGGEPEIAVQVRDALQKDIAGWTETDLKRAVGLAETALTRVPELSPLSLWRHGPVSNDLEGRTFMEAYWPMKTGNPWSPQKLADDMALVRLDELKEIALEMVNNAKVRIIPGS